MQPLLSFKNWFRSHRILHQTLVTIVIGGIIGILTWIFTPIGSYAREFVANGQLIKLLGGLTVADFEERIAKIQQSPLPDGTILIVDRAGCPPGWVDAGAKEPEAFAGRTIIAVGSYQSDKKRSYRDRGGSDSVTLTWGNIPPHSHRVVGKPLDVPIISGGLGSVDRGTVRLFAVDDRAKGADTVAEALSHATRHSPFESMPPFVALYFCRKP